MNESLVEWLGVVSSTLWNGPFAVVCLAGALFFTIRLGGVQIRGLPTAIRILRDHKSSSTSKGQLTGFQALAASLSGAVGLGNIAGVAIAVNLGGPGAIFWMWVSALLGGATKYAESLLGSVYRSTDHNGRSVGGPMFYAEKGLGRSGKVLAPVMAGLVAMSVITVGGPFQANQVAHAFNTYLGLPVGLVGGVVVLIAALVIMGGVKRIGKAMAILVPVMAGTYVLACLAICVLRWEAIGPALASIISEGLSWKALGGGAAGSVLAIGLRRGIFSHGAGKGSAAFFYGTTQSNHPAEDGLVGGMVPLIDTLIICTMTALVVLTAPGELSGAGVAMTVEAFESGLPGLGAAIVCASVFLFGLSTVISYVYYGEVSSWYLAGPKAITPYRLFFLGCTFAGTFATLPVVTRLADILVGLVLLVNMAALLKLSPLVAQLTRDYLEDEEAAVESWPALAEETSPST